MLTKTSRKKDIALKASYRPPSKLKKKKNPPRRMLLAKKGERERKKTTTSISAALRERMLAELPPEPKHQRSRGIKRAQGKPV